VWGLAGLVGPVLGGAIVHSLGWRWIFWVNLPFGIASAAVLAVAYHERPERAGGTHTTRPPGRDAGAPAALPLGRGRSPREIDLRSVRR